MAKVDGKEKAILKAEIAEEEQKIRTEKDILEYEAKLGQYLNSFNKSLAEVFDRIRASHYPYDANPSIEMSRAILKDILKIVKETKSLEKKL